MATANRNLSDYRPEEVPSAAGYRFGIVVSKWNEEITNALYEGARNTLIRLGASADDILTAEVPGSFELPKGAQWIAENHQVDAVICIGCVIQGDTPHFTYICQGVTQGLIELNLHFQIPFIFGLLTTLNIQQARDRSGGRYGNKGDEAAVTAIKMVSLGRQLQNA